MGSANAVDRMMVVIVEEVEGEDVLRNLEMAGEIFDDVQHLVEDETGRPRASSLAGCHGLCGISTVATNWWCLRASPHQAHTLYRGLFPRQTSRNNMYIGTRCAACRARGSG